MHTIKGLISVPRVLWLFLAVMWGTTWLVVRVGLDDLPPFTFAGVRFLVASAVLVAVAVARGARLPRDPADWLVMVGTGVTAIGVTYAFQFWGMQHVASGVAAVLFSTVPLLTILLAHVLLPDERMSVSKVAGVMLGSVGVALIFSDQLGARSPMAAWAILGFVIGAVALAHAQVVVRGSAHRLDPVVLAVVQTAVGGMMLLAVGAAREGSLVAMAWTPRALVAVAYLSLVGTALGFVLLYYLLRRMQVTKVNSMMLVHPLVAMLLGWLVLGETLGWQVVVGAAAIVSGLIPLLRSGQRAEPSLAELVMTGEYQTDSAE